MKAVLILVILGLIGSGSTRQVETSLTGDVLKKALQLLNELIDKAQQVLVYLADILKSSGEKLIDDIVSKINDIIDKAQQFLNSAGECGALQIDNLVNLGEHAITNVKSCISGLIPNVADVTNNLAKLIEAATKLSLDAADKIAKCELKGPILGELCLINEAKTLVPDIENLINKLTPVVDNAWKTEKDLLNCGINTIDKLENDITKIISDVNTCLSG